MTQSAGGRDDMPGGDDATRIVFRNDSDDEATKILTDHGTPPISTRRDPAGTVIGVANIQQGVRVAGRPSSSSATAPGNQGETVFITGQASASPGASRFDPVVGWLIVRKGPGRGQARQVYYGQNSVGRGNEQRVCLDFGDQRISREAHAFIVYDDALRKFFIRDNGKSNLLRVNGNLVMMPTELADRSEIIIGDTTLLFVALCGPDFDWLAENEHPAT